MPWVPHDRLRNVSGTLRALRVIFPLFVGPLRANVQAIDQCSRGWWGGGDRRQARTEVRAPSCTSPSDCQAQKKPLAPVAGTRGMPSRDGGPLKTREALQEAGLFHHVVSCHELRQCRLPSDE